MDIPILVTPNDEFKSCAGVFIDIDGVVLTGGKPYDWSKEALHTLWNNEVPFVFVTNGTYCSNTLVNNLTKIFDLPFTSDHCVVAPSPCIALTDYHDKHVLVCSQEETDELILELGFTSFITIDELSATFPDLDYVDHKRRKRLLQTPVTQELLDKQAKFKPIECIVLLGEPVNWECSLQLILDVLMTNGDPRKKFKFVPSPHLPVIAANKDLTFKGAAALPRFGHGAFLECLEAIYKKVTQNDLVYEQLMGKPYVITYQFASDQIQKLAKPGYRVNKFYIIGDNPDVDVRGGNTYKEFLQNQFEPRSISSKRQSLAEVQLQIQLNESKSGFKQVETLLVSTGVYNPQNDLLFHLKNLFLENNKNKEQQADDESSSKLTYKETNNRLDVLDRNELRQALSRKNSFISYFDNKLNIPDLTVNTLLDAVNYIIKTKDNLC